MSAIYEHLVVHQAMGEGGYEGHEAFLNAIAADGWRLVAVDNGIHYFEREKEKTVEPVAEGNM